MGYESNWAVSSDVVRNHYGVRAINEEFGGQVTTSGFEKRLSYTFDLAALISGAPATSNVLVNPATGELEPVIPAYAKIVSVKAEVIEALSTTGGSAATTASLQVGLDNYSAGAAIDVDGLIDATDGDLTIASNDIAEARGVVLVGSNAALVPNVSIGAAAGQVVANLLIDDITGMTAVAGKIRVVVEYTDEGT